MKPYKVTLYIYALIFSIPHLYCQEQPNSMEFYFVGHAYGNPNNHDKKISDELKTFITKNKNSSVIWGGDFIQNCNDNTEIKNFKNISSHLKNRYVLGNHDNCDSIKKHILRNKNTNSYEIIKDNLFIYLDTNFKDSKKVDHTLKFTLNILKNNKYKNIFIFSHQAIFSTSKFQLLTNSRSNYSLPNSFYNELKKTMLKSKKKFHLFSGDIGAFDYMPFAFYEKERNIYKYAVGLGNKSNHKILKISLNDSYEVNFIDLITNKEEHLKQYNASKIRLIYLPRLIQLYLKNNSFKILLFFLIFVVVLKTKKKLNF